MGWPDKTIGTALLLAAMLPTCASAQSSTTQPTPPTSYNIDGNGVDVVTGQYYLRTTDVAVGGGGDSGLSYGRYTRNTGYDDDYTSAINPLAPASGVSVTIGPITDEFLTGSTQSRLGTGATLTGGAGARAYTTSEGVVYQFSNSERSELIRAAGERVVQIDWPNGKRVTLEYEKAQVYTNISGSMKLVQISRVKAVSSNDGYRLVVRYVATGVPPSNPENPVNLDAVAGWYAVGSVVGTNAASVFCDTASTAVACIAGSGSTSPNVQYDWTSTGTSSLETRIDAMGRKMSVTYDGSGQITDVVRSVNNDMPVHLDYTGGRVTSYTIGYGTSKERTWTYAYQDNVPSTGKRTTTITSPTGLARVVVSDVVIGGVPIYKIREDKTGTAQPIRYTYDSQTRLTDVVWPELNKATYEYDGRSNITKVTLTPKSGTSGTIFTSASYPTSCTNPATCNQPDTTTDANGNVTNYEYTSFGAVSRVRRPGETSTSPHPEINYSFEQMRAWYRTSATSGIVQGTLIYKPTGSTTCSSAETCAGAATETVTEIDYGPGSSSQGRNLLPLTSTVRAGDSSVSSTTALTYNDAGDVTAIDGPLSPADDTSYREYNIARELVGTISPLPGGTGPTGTLKRRATRVTRDTATGLVTKVEAGTTDGTTLGTFAALQVVETSYDLATYLKTVDTARGTGAILSLTQYSYDDDLRPLCTARRVALVTATDVCAQGSTTDGYDQVAKVEYDTAGRLAKQFENGTATTIFTYDDGTGTAPGNGKLLTVKDANDTISTYGYDGYDRAISITYPGGTSDSVTYDDAGNVMTETRRGGATVTNTYTGRNRLATRTPSVTINSQVTTYTYDLFDRLTAATGSGSGAWANGVTNSYDALSRLTGQSASGVGGTHAMTMIYDLAGRRTRLKWGTSSTWGGGFYVDYDHLLTNEVTAIRENGATTGAGLLASYTYDDLGQRRALIRGNGVRTDWTPDGISRLKVLEDAAAGTRADQAVTLTYNGVSQLTRREATNDNYAFPNYAPATQSVTPNALNQMSLLNTLSPTYDVRGNLTGDTRGNSYGYNVDNQLVSKGSSPMLAYDPAGRLAAIAGSATVRFDYDGVDMVAENDASGNLTRRYVHGPGADEPLVWYEGSGTTDRRWLNADERGSITAITDAAGDTLKINAYDENGVPAERNIGRFGYTGQAWLPEVGLSYYKARMYAPDLGRFLQSDPIGYAGGMNLYAYVRGDPVNLSDPSGLCDDPVGGEIVACATRIYPNYDFGTLNFLNQYGVVPVGGFDYFGGGGGGVAPSSPAPPQRGLFDDIIDRAKDLYCSLPSLGLSASGRGYDVLGGGIVSDVAFDPQSGRLSVSAGVDVGVGFGGEVKWSAGNNATAGRSVANGLSASVGVSANARLGPVAAGASTTLIGRNGPGFGGVSAGIRPGGTGATVNANLGARFGYGGQIAPACPKK